MQTFYMIGLLAVLSHTAYSQDEEAVIRSNIQAFSQALMQGDMATVLDAYTPDGKIMPENSLILEGESLKRYWLQGPENGMIYHLHKITPVELNVLGDHAYDMGYYEGESEYKGKRSSWKGKYLIIWKKQAVTGKYIMIYGIGCLLLPRLDIIL